MYIINLLLLIFRTVHAIGPDEVSIPNHIGGENGSGLRETIIYVYLLWLIESSLLNNYVVATIILSYS